MTWQTPRRVVRFDILLSVTMSVSFPKISAPYFLLLSGVLVAAQSPAGKPSVASPQAASQSKPTTPPATDNSNTPTSVQTTTPQVNPAPIVPRAGLNVVVIDPAHGGTDTGGRGTEGIRESDVVLELAAQLRKTLEAQGFQVVQTRDGNDNPSFDDRSARANAQRGAVFVTLHVSSTGITGTARVYVPPDFPSVTDTSGMIQWERAQAPFVSLSRKLGDLVQMELAKRFKGSPTNALVAPVRQLRTTAAPAIAVEISSVSVENRADLERMVPGVADAITRGIVAFKPSYVVPIISSGSGVSRP
ncbi:MAG TPA: N-acetylmuramoyl-L-alanine amidase [Candidatus Acidoferrum sp.]